MEVRIRPTRSEDVPALQRIAGETELFPPEMLPEIIEPYISGSGDRDIWLTAERDGEAIGFCYAVPEKLADGVWNMLALAVIPSRQGSSVGHAIVSQLEAVLKQRDQRILIAETSSADTFARTREFYSKNNYTQEARIRDFWAAGDDKVIFWKALEGTS
jgi:N-acetylglutamate synthase-like GNAT family acetyltransferase